MLAVSLKCRVTQPAEATRLGRTRSARGSDWLVGNQNICPGQPCGPSPRALGSQLPSKGQSWPTSAMVWLSPGLRMVVCVCVCAASSKERSAGLSTDPMLASEVGRPDTVQQAADPFVSTSAPASAATFKRVSTAH